MAIRAPMFNEKLDFHLLQAYEHEIDAFLQLQNEGLKYAIREQKSFLLSSLEATTMATLRKTERELAILKTRAKHLEEALRAAETETEAWRRAAMEQEAMAAGLSSRIEQMRDAESACELGFGIGEEGGRLWCRWCHGRRSSVVFLPCRHVCVCGRCGRGLGFCPVCGAVKEGSVEVAER